MRRIHVCATALMVAWLGAIGMAGAIHEGHDSGGG